MRRRSAIVLSLVLLTAGVARPARADEPTPEAVEEAQRHFRRGIELYKEGDYRSTLLELRKAYELAPNVKVLFNIAQTQMLLQDYAGARATFKAYLEQSGPSLPKDRRTQVEEELAKLEYRVGRLEIRANVEGAEVTVDDDLVGKTPLDKPVDVSAGRRKVTVTTPRGMATRYVDVVGGELASLDLTVVEAPVEPIVQPPPPEPRRTAARSVDQPVPEVSHGRSAAPWIGLGITAVLAGGAVTSGLLALGAEGDLEDRINSPNASRDRIESARDRARLFGIGTDVLAGCAVVAAGVTTYLFIKSARSSHVNVGVAPGSVALSGRF